MLAAKFDQAARTGKRLRGVTADTRNIEFDVHLWSLERMHLAQLSAAGDIDGAIAVLREDLSNPRAHDQLLCFLEPARSLPRSSRASRTGEPAVSRRLAAAGRLAEARRA